MKYSIWRNLHKVLKPHVRDKRLYGTLTSGLMLIPVTHLTQCVAECAKCGFSGQANTTWGPSTEFSGPSPDSIWPSEFHRSIRTHNTLANHCTHNTRPHCHFDWWRYGVLAVHIFLWRAERTGYCKRGNIRMQTLISIAWMGFKIRGFAARCKFKNLLVLRNASLYFQYACHAPFGQVFPE